MTRHNDVPAGGDSEEPEATTALEGAALNLMFVRAALRRKRWLWVGTAVLGLILAAGMNLHRPVKFSAVTRINMAPSSTTRPGHRDRRRCQPSEDKCGRGDRQWLTAISTSPPEALLSHYKGAAVGDSIVEITTTAPSYQLAAQYADSARQMPSSRCRASVQGRPSAPDSRVQQRPDHSQRADKSSKSLTTQMELP